MLTLLNSISMYRRKFLVTVLGITGVLAGCAEDGVSNGETDQSGGNGEADQTDENGNAGQTGDATAELDGVETYSGDWSGTIRGESYSGVWQFDANFDEGRVEGWFEGDGEGDITGTVSGGEIDAQGGAAFGTVEWSGAFSADGGDISGTWELAEDLPGSGTWSGSVGELEAQATTAQETEEDPLPEEDAVSGDEPLERYPGSVMRSHSQTTTDEGTLTEIEYGTYDSLEDVEEWYVGKFGDPAHRESQDGEIRIVYMFGENEAAEITISDEEGYTAIDLVHRKN